MLFDDVSNNMLTSDKIGLLRGNMFNNEYIPYRNKDVQSINTLTEQDALKLKIYETNFALIDLGLYLDLHPNDNDVFERFQNCLSDFEKYKDMYEKQYGPLELTCVKGNSYNWINNPWPWDKDGGTKYV